MYIPGYTFLLYLLGVHTRVYLPTVHPWVHPCTYTMPTTGTMVSMLDAAVPGEALGSRRRISLGESLSSS